MRIVEWAPAETPIKLPPFGQAFESHIEAYRNSAARANSAAAWTLLHKVLAGQGLPVGTVAFGKHGKPFFAEGGVHFSLSHADGVVAVSVSDAPTGVDIERCDRPIRPHLVERCLTEREKQTYDGDFIRLWCRKECIVKLTGDGIYGYPDQIETDDPAIVFAEKTIVFGGETYRLCAAFSR